MITETNEIEVEIEHPLEEVFDIETGTTIVPRTEKSTVMTSVDEYDNKDNEVEEQFQEIYDAAFAAFEDQVAEAEVVEGKYKARNMEVGVQLLNAALSAAKEKANLKQHKDKLSVSRGKLTKGGNTTNNLIIDRNELLKAMLGSDT